MSLPYIPAFLPFSFVVEESESSNGDVDSGTRNGRDEEPGGVHKSLALAAQEGDMKTVKCLINNGELKEYLDVYPEKNRKRVLEQMSAKIAIVEMLLESRIAIIPSQQYVLSRPINRALFKVTLVQGTEVAINLLVNVSVVSNWDASRWRDRRKPLHIICGLPEVQPDTVKYILENSPDDINTRTTYNYTALIIAATCGNFILVRFLVENGACVNDYAVIPVDTEDQGSHYAYMKIFSSREVVIPPVPYHFSALVAAVFQDHRDTLIYLLNNGADITINNNTWTTLFHPVILGRTRIVEILLQNGVDANARDMMGSTALHKAAEDGHIEIAILLVKSGANVNATDNYGWTPLHTACLFSCNSKITTIRLLLESGSNVNAETLSRFTPLTLAEAGTNYPFLEYLIRKIDTLSASTEHVGLAEEHSTAQHADIIKLLIDRGANYNHQDDVLGWSALHWAAAEADLRVVRLLVTIYGVAVSSRSKMGLTPYETAKYFNRTAVSEFLKTAKDLRL